MSDQRRMPVSKQEPKAPHLKKPAGSIPVGSHHEIAKNKLSHKGLGGGKAFGGK